MERIFFFRHLYFTTQDICNNVKVLELLNTLFSKKEKEKKGLTTTTASLNAYCGPTHNLPSCQDRIILATDCDNIKSIQHTYKRTLDSHTELSRPNHSLCT